MPAQVRQVFGASLYEAQLGRNPDNSKMLKGFGGGSVLEIIEDYNRGSYRAVYTVQFSDAIYVLHVFQKKSHHRIETSEQDLRLIRRRLKDAEEVHLRFLG